MKFARCLSLLALLLACSVGCIHYHEAPDVQPTPAPNPDVLPEPTPPVQEKPGIVGPDEVKPGEPLWLSANVDEGAVVGWKVEHPQNLAFKVFEGGREFSSAGPMDAAEVRVALSVAKQEADKIDLRIVTKTITVKGQEPRPDPEPEPGPTPEKVGYALVVYRSEELPSHPNLAVLIQSDFGPTIQKAGGKFRFYDSDHPESGPQYEAELKQRFIELPGVLHYSLDGKSILGAFPIEKDMSKADVLAKLGVK